MYWECKSDLGNSSSDYIISKITVIHSSMKFKDPPLICCWRWCDPARDVVLREVYLVLWGCCVLVLDAGTLAVSIMDHLDLQTSQTSISVELTVVPVGLPIAATHWPLVGLTGLDRERKVEIRENEWNYKTLTWKNEKIKRFQIDPEPHQEVYHTPGTHLYTQTGGLPLLSDGTLAAGSTEHIGAHFTLALQLLKEKQTHRHRHCLRNATAVYWFHTWGGTVALISDHIS